LLKLKNKKIWQGILTGCEINSNNISICNYAPDKNFQKETPIKKPNHPGQNEICGFFGSVEILERNKQSLVGVPAHRAFAPAAQASPNSAIIIRRLKKNPDKRGGKGMHPLGCLPLRGRVGVALITIAENKRMTLKRGFQQSRF
jgi:hypothetical protein